RIPVGAAPGGPPTDAVVPAPAPADLRIVLGPRQDWFTAAALVTLTNVAWRVRSESDRIGIRLQGPRLERAVPGELPSEPTLPGALQVPPDGRPILLGPDAPVTGGYPVVAVVVDADLDRAAQLRAGDPVRFAAHRAGLSP
ncbi:MAG: allophanate hydrolase subunit 2 family protein, partial [Jatrophihabitans sp.]